MGERLHDGERGWFPSRVVEDIQSKEVRVQNLREAFRIQQTQEGGGGQLTGARVGLRVGRRTPKVSNFSSHWIDQMGESSAVKQWVRNKMNITIQSHRHFKQNNQNNSVEWPFYDILVLWFSPQNGYVVVLEIQSFGLSNLGQII